MFSLAKDGPERVADWRNWPTDLNVVARNYQKASYFDTLRGSFDAFDNIRLGLRKAKQDDEERVALAFTQWFEN